MPTFINPLHTLPNGTKLHHRVRGEHGNQYKWFRDRISPSFEKGLKARNKSDLPLLGLWNSGSDQVALAADVDKLPPGYTDFSQVVETLEQEFGLHAVVVRSVGGKAKAIFVVQLPLGMSMNVDTAFATLRGILGDRFSWIDKVESSLQLTFLNEEISRALSEKLHTRIPIDACVVHDDLFSTLYHASSYVDYWIPQNSPHEGEIPIDSQPYRGSLAKWTDLHKFAKTGKIRERLIRTLLSIPSLITGYDLPQSYLSRRIGGKQPNLSKAFSTLEADGQLKMIRGHKVLPRPLAKRYVATGQLRDVLTKIHAEYKERTPLASLAADIGPGNFYKIAWRIAVGYFRTDEAGFRSYMASHVGDSRERQRRLDDVCRQLFAANRELAHE